MTNPETLNIASLLSEGQYIVPIYQRNYAWGQTEIETLINDINSARQQNPEKPYYIGSLVVNRNSDRSDVFEVIDGQQRLTTLSILAGIIGRCREGVHLPRTPNVSFEHRSESDDALKKIFAHKASSSELNDLPEEFKLAAIIINSDREIISEDFINFLLNKVEIIRIEVPHKTDLNHYFEIMNTRGEQLEKHEVLKARLMAKLEGADRNRFALIWDACSDMSKHIQQNISPDLREVIFRGQGKLSLLDASENSDEFFRKILTDSDQANSQAENQHSKTIEQILSSSLDEESKTGSAKQQKPVNDSEVTQLGSIIDFANFLMHVRRIFSEQEAATNSPGIETLKNIPLNEKNLLAVFSDLDKSGQQERIRRFAVTLLQCRYLFDRYIIKSDNSSQSEDNWHLQKYAESEVAGNYFKNTFTEPAENKNVIMLQAMFHVSYFTRTNKNWLYATLRWLYKQKQEIDATSYIGFLEDLSDRFYFGHYIEREESKEFIDVILSNSLGLADTAYEHDDKRLTYLLDVGTQVPNFIFNRLDYLLWKYGKPGDLLASAAIEKFRFTFRHSVEHFYPQNPSGDSEHHWPANVNDGEDKELLHSFGNLCLISSSMNSKFSNNMPIAKEANYGNANYLSLKLSIMMAQADDWKDRKTVEEHRKQMVELLNKRCNELP